jgi:hypothetical protein
MGLIMEFWGLIIKCSFSIINVELSIIKIPISIINPFSHTSRMSLFEKQSFHYKKITCFEFTEK